MQHWTLSFRSMKYVSEGAGRILALSITNIMSCQYCRCILSDCFFPSLTNFLPEQGCVHNVLPENYLLCTKCSIGTIYLMYKMSYLNIISCEQNVTPELSSLRRKYPTRTIYLILEMSSLNILTYSMPKCPTRTLYPM